MRIAILGATGQIGRGLSRAYHDRARLTLFARRPDRAASLAEADGIKAEALPFDRLADGEFDLIINAVGDGVPGRIRAAGADILDVTAHFDAFCLSYLERHPTCGYVFLSTGAIYGPDYAGALRPEQAPQASLAPDNFYARAKLEAEDRHRRLSRHSIADVRLFGYVSPEIDLGSDFLVAQMLDALVERAVFVTQPADIVRDYVGLRDLVGLIDAWIGAGRRNGGYDLLSAAPTSKMRILDALKREFGLAWETEEPAEAIELAALPPRLSLDRSAEALGFRPQSTSLDNVLSLAHGLMRARERQTAGAWA
ncbi:NAD-dependent epimerase/dehydratase family protein [Jiella marina]|uniref:NAD-dependent epimerase/dehydratase family protein n=1 Tax=Jiella sp. LLJ827 TaxID=2917712 RepID=UPI00210197B3|nr:NAD(P)-dependent oxidoreductase [Jiella sp. LLJ827]MCQ0987997.1 NAD(P)-dependent oxidoreductase [Jiella sp. LLJ827]